MSLESSPSTASEKHKCLTKHELSKKSKKSGTSRQVGRAGKRAEWEEKKVTQPWRTKLGKKLGGRLIFRKEDTNGCYKRLTFWSDVVNWKVRLASAWHQYKALGCFTAQLLPR